MGSLNARLLFVACITIAAFLGITGVSLDRAFRESAKTAVWERLRAEVYMLLGAVTVDGDGGLRVPDVLPDPRLSTPGSGLYARISGPGGEVLWRSESLLGASASFAVPGDPGLAVTTEATGADGVDFFAMTYTVAWEVSRTDVRHFAFSVAEDRSGFNNQIGEFRHGLWTWFLAGTVLLLLVQAAVLRWGLLPLRRVAEEVNRIESGSQAELAGPYPRELEPLTRNLNALINSSREHLARYRNALGDLAHSLKTPLAVIRANLDELPESNTSRAAFEEQLSRIDQTIDYQLQRAAASGRTALTKPLEVEPIVRRVAQSLQKVYARKDVVFELAVDERAKFHGDEGDLMEICGNLMDNACKWCVRRVRVHCALAKGSQPLPPRLELTIEDDGPGVDPSLRDSILDRGVRGDLNAQGHGIGLAVVRELVEGVYRGSMRIESCALGGASLKISIPQ